MKPTVLITKIGSVCYTKEYTRTKRNLKNAARGEQGTTEAVVNHLLKRGDIRVVYFGKWYGELPEGLIYVEWENKGLGAYSLSKEQKDKFKIDIARLDKYAPFTCFVTIAGYAANNSLLDNEYQVICQACSVRMIGPVINVLDHYKLPRIVVLNDIRNYPNEHEMTWFTPYMRPAALLSQREREWSRIIHGKRWYISERYAAAEHWRDFDEKTQPNKTHDCLIVGHAHMKDGKKLKHHDEAWRKILNSFLPINFKIYGSGWEHFSGYDPKIMPGLANADEIFSKAKTTVITITGGELYTNKARFALSKNCLPLFYGRGGPHTMDPLGKYIPLDDPSRIYEPGSLWDVVQTYCRNPATRQNVIDRLWEKTKPDWSMLDNCINDLINGRDYNTPEWRADYGGYYERKK